MFWQGQRMLKQALDIKSIKAIELFQGVTDSQASELLKHFKLETLTAKSYVLTAGRSSGNVFILLDGSAKIVTTDAEGKEVLLALCGYHDILGDLDAVDGLGHSASVITLQECRALWIHASKFNHFRQTIPALNANLVVLSANRLRRLSLKFRAKSELDIPGCVAWHLLMYARDYGIPTDSERSGLLIPLRLTQRDVAAMAGVSRKSVSESLKSLKHAGAISFDPAHRVIVHNEALLARRCQQLPLPPPRFPLSPQWDS
jgi:CRP/FNR family cyclic AMP-dependent transcriptional regulator